MSSKAPKAKKKIIGKHFDSFHIAEKELDKKIKTEGKTAVKAFFKEYFELNPSSLCLRQSSETMQESQ